MSPNKHTHTRKTALPICRPGWYLASMLLLLATWTPAQTVGEKSSLYTKTERKVTQAVATHDGADTRPVPPPAPRTTPVSTPVPPPPVRPAVTLPVVPPPPARPVVTQPVVPPPPARPAAEKLPAVPPPAPRPHVGQSTVPPPPARLLARQPVVPPPPRKRTP